jgi:hypothetical protein
MIFVETAAFTRRVASRLKDEELRELQSRLIAKPDSGDLIRGSGGLRKVRVSSSGRGKSGGARVIYYWVVSADRIWLFDVYAKNEKGDLTKSELKAIKTVLDAMKKGG